jgi:hypothetical protein
LAVIEFLGAGIPLDDVEVPAVVIGMAMHAFLPCAAFELDFTAVEAAFGQYSISDLNMA